MTLQLPLPRLVLNVAALGNRKFGRSNKIDVEDAELQKEAASRCREILQEITSIIQSIHLSEKEAAFAPVTRGCSYWLKTRVFGWMFGSKDRWQRTARVGKKASVFNEEKPLVQLIGGLEPGGDTLIGSVAKELTCGFTEFRYLPIEATEAGTTPKPDVLSVGEIPPSWKGSVEDVLPRADAATRANTQRLRSYGFRAQSQALRHHCDIMLAIWDVDAISKAGGTHESVIAALRERIPVLAIRFDKENRARVDLLETLEDMKDPIGKHASTTSIRLAACLKRILCFPDHTATSHEATTGYDPRVAFHYLREAEAPNIWTAKFRRGFSGLLEEVFKGKKPPRQPAEGAFGTMQFHYDAAKVKASDFARAFGDAHRGGIFVAYILGAMAVAFAICGAIGHQHHWGSFLLIGFALAELIAIIVLFALSCVSSVEDWHAVWADARVLSEALRSMKYLAPIGMHTPLPKLPQHLGGVPGAAESSVAEDDPRRLWSVWYFRALVRQAPLVIPNPDFPDLASLKKVMLNAWIGEYEPLNKNSQVRYHRDAFQNNNRTYHQIERWGLVIFALIAVSASLHLFELLTHRIGDWSHPVCMLACTLGPAILAALSGYLAQIEAVRLRSRSDATLLCLHDRRRVLGAIDVEGPEKNLVDVRWPFIVETTNTAGLMIDEAAAWSLIYKSNDIHAG